MEEHIPRIPVAINVEAVKSNVESGSALLKAMGNPHRLLVLSELMAGEKCVGDLEAVIGLSQSALSQHLARLRREQLVKTRRDAQTIYYSLKGGSSVTVLAALSMVFSGATTNEDGSPLEATVSDDTDESSPNIKTAAAR